MTLSLDQPLFDAGFDSITAEEFVGKLQEKLISGGWVGGTAAAVAVEKGGGREGEEAAAAALVNSTTMFDCPTARHMAEHIERSLFVGAGTAGGDGDAAGLR